MKNKVVVTIETDECCAVSKKGKKSKIDVLHDMPEGMLCTQPAHANIDHDLTHIDDPRRRGMVAKISRMWVNGTHITYMLMPEPLLTDADLKKQHDVVDRAFKVWEGLPIGITFERVYNRANAMVRIGFIPGKGSWSYIGNMCLKVTKKVNTVNFGWPMYKTKRGFDTALHEIGHVLALTHEHQSPNNGIEWDRDKVYATFSKPPNSWSKGKIDRNILNKMTAPNHSTKWDKDSIMEYPFPAGMITKPAIYKTEPLRPEIGLSDKDIAKIKELYPKINTLPTLSVNEVARISDDEPASFGFYIDEKVVGDVTIEFIGRLDCVLILYKMSSAGVQFIEAKATRMGREELSFPTKLKCKLEKGVKYKLMGRSTKDSFSTHDAALYMRYC